MDKETLDLYTRTAAMTGRLWLDPEEWQPPVGTPVLGLDEDGLVWTLTCFGRDDEGEAWGFSCDDLAIPIDGPQGRPLTEAPLYWMPLPTPPKP